MTLPRLELTEDPNNKNEFIIFRHQIKGKKISKESGSKSKKSKISPKKTRKNRKKSKKSRSLFNIF